MIHRLARFHLDDGFQAVTAFLRLQDEIRIQSGGSRAHGRILFGSGIHPGFVLSLRLCVQQANDAVVLELLSNGPHENRTHVSASVVNNG
jgi:hypothetical protein